MARILLADDEEVVRSVMGRFLERNGYEVVEAANGAEALSLLGNRELDLGFVDQVMPGLSGVEVIQSARRQGCRIPLVMVTAHAEVDLAVAAFKAGAQDFLCKCESLLEDLLDLVGRYGERGAVSKEERVVSYVRRFFSRIRSREEVAEALGVSADTVSCHVKQLTGMGFERFVQACRLEEACRLLEQTDRTVKEIAYEVGFSSPSFFCRRFREEKGVTPQGYRLKCREARPPGGEEKKGVHNRAVST